MSKLKTVWDLVHECFQGAFVWSREDEGAVSIPHFLDNLNEHGSMVILPLAGGSVVVERGALEAAGEAMCKAARRENNMLFPWAKEGKRGRAQYCEDALAILTALFPAGIEVAEAVFDALCLVTDPRPDVADPGGELVAFDITTEPPPLAEELEGNPKHLDACRVALLLKEDNAMTEPKTLGEMLTGDRNPPSIVSLETAASILYWLNAHNIADATPLEVEAVGEVYVEQSLMDRETGEWLQEVVLDGNDITDRTMALLTKPQAAKSGEIDGNG